MHACSNKKINIYISYTHILGIIQAIVVGKINLLLNFTAGVLNLLFHVSLLHNIIHSAVHIYKRLTDLTRRKLIKMKLKSGSNTIFNTFFHQHFHPSSSFPIHYSSEI